MLVNRRCWRLAHLFPRSLVPDAKTMEQGCVTLAKYHLRSTPTRRRNPFQLSERRREVAEEDVRRPYDMECPTRKKMKLVRHGLLGAKQLLALREGDAMRISSCQMEKMRLYAWRTWLSRLRALAQHTNPTALRIVR